MGWSGRYFRNTAATLHRHCSFSSPPYSADPLACCLPRTFTSQHKSTLFVPALPVCLPCLIPPLISQKLGQVVPSSASRKNSLLAGLLYYLLNRSSLPHFINPIPSISRLLFIRPALHYLPTYIPTYLPSHLPTQYSATYLRPT